MTVKNKFVGEMRRAEMKISGNCTHNMQSCPSLLGMKILSCQAYSILIKTVTAPSRRIGGTAFWCV